MLTTRAQLRCKFMATSHLAATLVQKVPADSGNFPWYMTDSIVVVEDNYSEVVVNVIDLALNSVAQRRVSETLPSCGCVGSGGLASSLAECGEVCIQHLFTGRDDVPVILYDGDVRRPRSFVNVMSTSSTLDPVSTVLCRMLL